MGKHRNLLMALGLAVLVGIGAWLTWRQFTLEPRYQGKSLHVWLAPQNTHLDGGHVVAGLSTEGREAVQQLGTNAIPTLLRMLRARDSSVKRGLAAWLQSQHLIKFNYVYVDAAHQHAQAAAAFDVLGAAASDATPALVKIFEEDIANCADPDWPSGSAALHALAAIGSPARGAVPALLRQTTGTNLTAICWACITLGKIHSDPDLVVPALTRCLDNPPVRYNAIVALEQFCPAAKPAVSKLFEAFNDQLPYVRAEATNAIKQIDPEAAAKIGIQ